MVDDPDAARQLGSFERACPVRTAIGVIAGKWKPSILRAIDNGQGRYVDIRADVAGISDQALTRHLRELSADGVIERSADGVVYRLTARGALLADIMEKLEAWGDGYLAARPPRRTWNERS